ncbi:heat-shock protein Hsp20 [Paenibacillus sp. FSL R7-0273]|uniref:Hsp20/alpha crystallin family protein n=1 Tax=Paenibacillus sp. FSL R7-0273 TaxID=1536772 RepID=UPI0004F883D6|nr:Hsp20/alpha crystallin family protein [Paenibacillus sp. FSL R7-0273]AIQ44707.1 heat-shock protein Hsp20 [Paenibacillus sp. FSL R7-0273]OMF93432.1 heat-shock protein Hsp20 [Paenibacillus sp. FSL R7-0273]
MFDLVPFGKRRDDVFGALTKSLHDVFNDEFFAPMTGGSALSFRTDIRESEQAYLIEAELPGFGKDDIDIDYSSPYLTIKAVRREEKSEENDKQQVVRRERRYGEYVRRFYVQDISGDDIRATLKDGLLTLEVPKRQKAAGKRIEIQDNGSTGPQLQ